MSASIIEFRSGARADRAPVNWPAGANPGSAGYEPMSPQERGDLLQAIRAAARANGIDRETFYHGLYRRHGMTDQMSRELDRRRLPAVMRELVEFQIEALSKRVKANPADTKSRSELAQALAAAGDYHKAISHLEELKRRMAH